MPYLVLFYRQQGYSGWQIGLLTSLGPLASLVGGLLWTGLADATRRHRLVFTTAGLAAIGLTLLYPSAQSFAALLALVLLYCLSAAPLIPLADASTMFMLGEDRSFFGRIRLGGTLGWGLCAPLIGLLLDRWGQSWMFALYALALIPALLAGQMFQFAPPEHAGESVTRGVKTLLANPRWVLFLEITFIAGLGMAITNNYLSLYLESLGASRSFIGLALTVTTLSELPVLFFGNRLLDKFSPGTLVLMGIGINAARLLISALTNQPVPILLAGLVHGLTFPLTWIAGVSYAHHNAPAGMAATAQGIVGHIMVSFGAAAGGFIGGALLSLVDVRGMFTIIGSGLLAALLLLMGLQMLMARKEAAVRLDASYD